MNEPLDLEPIKALLESESWLDGIRLDGSELYDLIGEVEDLRRRMDEALAEPQHDPATEDRMRTVLGAAPHRRKRL